MIKTTRYCDICGREINIYYQMDLPERDWDGNITISLEKKDVCENCLEKLYLKFLEIKYPNRKCPD